MKARACRLAIVLALSLLMSVPARASAGVNILQACQQVQGASASSVCQAQHSGTSNPVIFAIKVAVNILSFAGGFIAVIMVLVGSIQLITARGDPSRVETARRTVLYALGGVALIAASASLVTFFLNRI